MSTYHENSNLFLELVDMGWILIGHELQLKSEVFKFNLFDAQVPLHILQLALQVLNLWGIGWLVIKTNVYIKDELILC